MLMGDPTTLTIQRGRHGR